MGKIVIPEYDRILSLLEEYSYRKLNEDEISKLFIVSLDINTCKVNSDKLDLATFIKFLYLCGRGEGEYKITSTIKDTEEGKVKGTKEEIIISGYLVDMLHIFAEMKLNSIIKDYYNQPYIRENYEDYRHEFTYKELNTIINDTKKKNEGSYNLSRNEELGLQTLSIIRELDILNIPKKPKRKLYSFIYDLLVIREEVNDIGKGFSSIIGKEKAEYIRNCIKAYNKKQNSSSKTPNRTHIQIDFF